MAQPRIKFTVKDYMTAPPDKRYQLLDGEMILAPSPTERHQTIVGNLYSILRRFGSDENLGRVWFAPLDVVLSQYDVVQPDIFFIASQRTEIITEANIQGAPDLVVEVLSPATVEYDRGYKQTLYSRSGVGEYWLVDPQTETVEVLTRRDEGLTLHASYRRRDTLTSPLLAGLAVDIDTIFA